MKIAIPREIAAGETRVAATDETVATLMALDLDVVLQAAAGEAVEEFTWGMIKEIYGD